MKKLLFIFVAVFLLTNLVYAAEVTITIPDAKVDRVKSAMEGVYPIPRDPITHKPLFTQAQWVKKCLINFIVRTVHIYETEKAVEGARKTIKAPEDIAQ